MKEVEVVEADLKIGESSQPFRMYILEMLKRGAQEAKDDIEAMMKGREVPRYGGEFYLERTICLRENLSSHFVIPVGSFPYSIRLIEIDGKEPKEIEKKSRAFAKISHRSRRFDFLSGEGGEDRFNQYQRRLEAKVLELENIANALIEPIKDLTVQELTKGEPEVKKKRMALSFVKEWAMDKANGKPLDEHEAGSRFKVIPTLYLEDRNLFKASDIYRGKEGDYAIWPGYVCDIRELFMLKGKQREEFMLLGMDNFNHLTINFGSYRYELNILTGEESCREIASTAERILSFSFAVESFGAGVDLMRNFEHLISDGSLNSIDPRCHDYSEIFHSRVSVFFAFSNCLKKLTLNSKTEGIPLIRQDKFTKILFN